MIAQEVLEAVARANDIVDVIGGYFPLKRAGAIYKALCPFHQERTPSFNVNPARQTFKCFGCGAGGSVLRFVEMYENIPFPEAVRRLAARAGMQMPDEQLTPEEEGRQRLRRRLLALHAEAATWFQRNLLRTRVALGAREYLKSRGITGEIAKRWQLGYAPESWDALSGTLLAAGFTERELIASGVVTPREGGEGFYDRFRDRLMFPICDDLGNVIAFSGRVLPSDKEVYGGKYVNSPETAIFTKGKVLFGLHMSKRAIIDARSAILCEGQLDVIATYEAGFKNVIAAQGTAFTVHHAQILHRHAQQEVILCFDADGAGLKAAERALPPLLDAGLAVRLAVLPSGSDPDSMIREQGAEAFRTVLDGANDYFDFQIERFAASPAYHNPRERAAFASQMAEGVAMISDAVLREAVMTRLSSRLEIATERFAALLPKVRSPRLETRSYEEAPEEEPARTPRVPLSNTLRLLCQLLLFSPEVKAWLATQPYRELIGDFPDGELPLELISGRFEPGEPNSIAAFLSTLDPGAQDEVATLLELRHLPPQPLAVAQECWCDLLRTSLTRRREALTARLRQPGLDEGEIGELQKQVLDLTRELTHITRPLSHS